MLRLRRTVVCAVAAASVRALTTTEARRQGSRLPFTVDDVDAERLSHPYWAMAGGGPYDFDSAIDEAMGDTATHLSPEDKDLLRREYLEQP